jgi:hypothetical protein
MKYIQYIVLLCVVLGSNLGYCQINDKPVIPTQLPPETGEIFRPAAKAELPNLDSFRINIKASLPPASFSFPFMSDSLRPLDSLLQPMALPFSNYVKIGYGSLSTKYAELGIGSLHWKNVVPVLQFNYYEQTGDIQYQKIARGNILAGVLYHRKKTDWNTTVQGNYNQYYYYGYNHDLYIYPEDSVKQTYMMFKATEEIDKVADANAKFNYSAALSYSVLNAAFRTSETSFGLKLPMSYKISNNLSAIGAVTADVAQMAVDDTAQNNNLYSCMLGCSTRNEIFGISGYGYIKYFATNNGSNSLYPGFEFSRPFVLPYDNGNKTYHFLLSLGFKPSMRQNTYEQLTRENPYIGNNYTVNQSVSNQGFIHFSSSNGNHISYSGRLSYWSFTNLPTFVPEYNDLKKITVLYDNVDAVSLNGAASYAIVNNVTWIIAGSFDAYIYGAGTAQQVWGLPSFKANGSVTCQPMNGLKFGGTLNFLNGIYYPDAGNNPHMLPQIFDINLTGEMQLDVLVAQSKFENASRFSAFVHINNLLNTLNERWQGYRGFGFNALIGFGFKF